MTRRQRRRKRLAAFKWAEYVLKPGKPPRRLVHNPWVPPHGARKLKAQARRANTIRTAVSGFRWLVNAKAGEIAVCSNKVQP